MNKIMVFALTLLLGAALFSGDACARRFGGGKSFGKQREQITQPASPSVPGPAAPMRPASPGSRSWAGPLAGLAAGGLLGALLFGHGFEGITPIDVMVILIVGGAIFLFIRGMRRPAPYQPMQYADMGEQRPAPVSSQTIPSGTAPPSTRPEWFEEEPFLRAAKGHFIRLQDAYDRGELNDIREYTTPEVFAEISLQIQERGSEKNKTDVVQLNASLIDLVTEGDHVIASVRFSGLMREEEDAPAHAFEEIWHIQKSASDRNAPWYVAGVQQV
jgi:predicted lipid-binding transport protein (Tim44 family)